VSDLDLCADYVDILPHGFCMRDLLAEGRWALTERRPAHTISVLRMWLKEHRDDADAWGLLGQACFQLGDWAGAEAAAREAVRACPDSPTAWRNLAVALGRLDRGEEAEEALQRAAELERAVSLGPVAQRSGPKLSAPPRPVGNPAPAPRR